MKKLLLGFSLLFLSAEVFSQCSVTVTGKSVSCNGLCDGTATATPFGGVAPYAYSWSTSPAQIAQKASGLCAGAYTVTVIDSKGCSATQSVTVNQPPALAVSSTVQNIRCNGGTNGRATAVVTGGTTPYKYTWSTTPAQTTRTANGLTIGTYTLTVSDRSGCTGIATDTIKQPAVEILSSTSVASSCGSPNGSAAVSVVSGGTAPFTYAWSSGATSATASNVSAGSYNVTITDANGCPSKTTVTVGSSSGLTATVSSTNVTCAGATDGTATANPTGGTAGYTYSWSTTATTKTVTALSGGTYTVTVTDASACSISTTIQITRPTALAVTLTKTNVSCNGNSNGSVTSVVTGGTTPYTYTWSNATTKAMISNEAAGTYTLTVTDAHGCSATKTSTITQPVSLTVTVTKTNVSCNAGTNGTATATGTGGTVAYTYTWSTTPAQTTKTATKLGAGTYTVTLADANGCVAVGTVAITQPATTTLTTSSSNTGCGTPNGSASVAVTGGTTPYFYAWSNGSTSSTDANIGAGTYTVTVTDSKACKSTTTSTVNSSSGLTASVSAVNVTCNGSANGTATASVVGGASPYTYSWNSVPAQTTATATNLKNGTYKVTVTDANSCSFVANTTITQPTAIVIAVTKVNVTCNGSANGSASATVTGGKSPYTYSWSSGSTSAIAGALPAATYTLMVTDASGCSSTRTTTVTAPAAITATKANVNISCNDGANGVGSVTIAGGTAPYTYDWSTNPAQTTRTASGLMAGNYSVTVTDSKGCSVIIKDTLTQPAAIVPVASSSNATCGSTNGSASIAVTGGTSPYAYSWSSGSTATTISNLAAGTYNVKVTDSKGCTQTATAIISNTGGATVSITSIVNETCNGSNAGSAIASTTGGAAPYTYSWSNGSTAATLTNLAAGGYTVTVKDANNCNAFSNVTITGPSAILITIAQSGTTCNAGANGSASANVSGGTGAFTYNWSNGNTTMTANGLVAGIYTLNVTDANGCSAATTTSVTQPAAITPIFIPASVICNGGSTGAITSFTSGGTPGYSYKWSNGDSTAKAISLIAGTYVVTITDANACTVAKSASVTEPAKVTATTTNTQPSCNGGNDGTATVTAAGGVPAYSYQWSTNPVQVSATATGLMTGKYMVTVNDKNGCIVIVSDSIGQPIDITPIATSTNSTCGSSNGSVSATATGGSGSYTYSWSTGSTASTANNLAAGAYAVTVTDNKGCSSTTSVIVSNTGGATASINSIVNVSCTGAANGSAVASATGGVAPYTYSWSNGSTSAKATGFTAGGYTVTVKDANGCLSVSNISITEPIALSILMSEGDASCHATATGLISANVSGGTGTYSYTWSDTQTAMVAINLMAGNYTVTVSDANACTLIATSSVGQPAAITAAFTQTSITCNGESNGTSTATAIGGTAGYMYVWSNGDSAVTATGLAAGTYTVTITDANTCSASITNTVIQPTAITLTSSSTNALCGKTDGSALVTAAGGRPPYAYIWTTSPAQTTKFATGLGAGIYSVDVTDTLGCVQMLAVTVGNTNVGSLNITSSEISCNGGADGAANAVMTGGTGPYTYSWIQSAGSHQQISNLTAGIYTVQVVDANGCTAYGTTTVSEPAAITVTKSVSGASCPTCPDGSATITASGGNGSYTYSWSSTPAQTTATASNLIPATYSVCVTDLKGCVDCDTVLVDMSVTGISTISANVTPISIKTYPNPTTGEFKVEITATVKQDMYIRIVDLIGQTVFVDQQTQATIYDKMINIQGYTNGMYILQVITPDRSYSQRIILQQ